MQHRLLKRGFVSGDSQNVHPLDEELEDYYFSKDKLLPRRRNSGSQVFERIDELFRLRKSTLLAVGLGVIIFLGTAFILHHFMTSEHSLFSSTSNEHITNSISDSDEKITSGDDHRNLQDIEFSYVSDSELRKDLVSKVGSKENLEIRVNELENIRKSVLDELNSLQERRQSIRKEIAEQTVALDNLKENVEREQFELSTIYKAIEAAKLEHSDQMNREIPEVFLPMRLEPPRGDLARKVIPLSVDVCNTDLCFDYARCSATAGLNFFVYQPSTSSELLRDVYLQLRNDEQYSPANTACLFIVLTDHILSAQELQSLDWWRGSGRNHVIWYLTTEPANSALQASVSADAMVSSASFSFGDFRPNFDLLTPPLQAPLVSRESVWKTMPPVLPAKRQFLLTFWSEYWPSKNNATDSKVGWIFDRLRQLQETKTHDLFYMAFDCSSRPFKESAGVFALCDTKEKRSDLLKHSTFVLLLPDINCLVRGARTASLSFSIQLMEALQHGAIPVILGSNALLPFEEVLDWNRVAIRLPLARLPELHLILRAISSDDLLEMRLNGRNLFTHYLSSSQVVTKALLATLRTRLRLPPVNSPVAEFSASMQVFTDGWQPPPSQTTDMPLIVDPDDYLGPLEPPFPSPRYQQNFTLQNLHSYDLWNSHMTPFHLYPNLPFSKPLPTGARFLQETSFGFRPISSGAGGSGKEFSQSLGGNFPREQFTVVILTYDRERVLVNSLQRLNKLPYLNKVIVVWNSASDPSADIVWPVLSVPLVVLKTGKNSLNNRFLPFQEIETEAVLSLDDDVHLNQAEIIFAFRVWREERNKIVGFPGRFHAWDVKHESWLYNSNHSCELSMVLTGAAFFHKYYAYLYTHHMPQVIRDKVDEVVNCEDLAMNFLVAHLIRRPPVKVTSKWTFRCPGCPENLSNDESHFVERHECMQFFTKVYGYNPLLNTQFRADSVLFKTKLPHIHQKCFKFI